MANDKRTSMSTDMNEDIDLYSDMDMTDQERDALNREIADSNKRTRAKSM